MRRDIRGSVALITGAGRGIGRAIARGLAEEGCDVGLMARSEGELEETARLCREQGVRALPFPVDLADGCALETAVRACVERLGGLNILVNNAGISEDGPATEADLDGWERMLRVNLLAAMQATRLALPHILQANGGAVIFIASLAAKFTAGGMAGYVASKHGLLGFSGSVFEDVRERDIKVCAICPGWTDTGMMDTSAFAREGVIQPEDVADAVRFVVTFPLSACPTEIVIHPQHRPQRLKSRPG